MTNVVSSHGVPAPRRALARQLRELAELLEGDQLDTEPYGIMMCLMGATQFEVVGVGETEGWSGARQAMCAVLGAQFDTVGGNIRPRDHAVYQPRKAAAAVPLVVATKSK
ncbi:hypothetical protein K3722_07630 [Leisingera caerulea]|uniref:Uncharacterized protein n=1 Tax=Leisingera caerulea TaxID=506591 RepID=A0ABY5X076_LEICA|nr:hypothetical protein [Leisingera caerulea]UWQ59992.1 hypothetical protein K3722_07630 [Leisingera caerulea]